jgi:hypothetical protein
MPDSGLRILVYKSAVILSGVFPFAREWKAESKNPYLTQLIIRSW